MFGYVQPDPWTLPLCEYALYRAFYCGMCVALKQQHGARARLTLTYDSVFLALLQDALCGEPAEIQVAHCPLRPFKKKPTALGPSLASAAQTQSALLLGKAQDDARDGQRLHGLLIQALLWPNAQKIAKNPQYARIEKMNADQHAIEQPPNNATVEQAAHPFATFLGELVHSLPMLPTEAKETGRWLGYHVGKWIYLMDALDDFDADKKKGRFNPLIHAYENTEQAWEQTTFLLNQCGAQALSALDMLPLHRHEGLLTNILTDGLYQQALSVRAGKGAKRGTKSLSSAGSVARRLRG